MTDARPIVLCDCDGILADFVGGILPILSDVAGRTVTHDDIDQFDIAAALKLERADAAKFKRTIGSTPGLAASLSPLAGAREGIRALSDLADVYIITSPWNSNQTWTFDREAWLEKHFGIHHGHVIHTSAKWLVHGDVFIDDKTSAVEEWAAFHPMSYAVRWNTPHNRNDTVTSGVVRTDDWSLVLGIVKELADAAA